MAEGTRGIFTVDTLPIIGTGGMTIGVDDMSVRGRRHAWRRATRLAGALVVTVGLGLLAPVLAQAVVFTVTTTTDSNDGACTATLCSFRDALNAADGAPANTATVVVPAGTYKATLTAGNGDFSPGGQYTIQGAGPGQTIIDGNQLDRVFAFYGQITVSGVTVTGGRAPMAGCTCGGAFEVRGGGFLTLTNSIVEGNSSPATGGGIDVDSQSKAILQNDLITQNTAAGAGGGVHVGYSTSTQFGTVQITNTTISANTTTSGAAGAGLDNAGSATATNVTFAGNSSSGSGGAITNESTGTLSVTAATIAGNLATGPGAGINNVAGGHVMLRNTIADDGCAGTLSSQGHNLDRGTTCGLTQTGDLSNVDPRLAQIALNGGSVPTIALLAGSPAIDAGDNSACPSSDARGVARPQGGACDIGAYEFAPPTLALGSPTGVSALAATVQGTLTPNLRDATYHFNYGTSTAYGHSTASTDAGSGNTAVPVAAAVAGLLPNTTYHYELVATNGDGTSTTADGTFTTLPSPMPTSTAPHLSVVKQSARRWAERRVRGKHKTTVGTTFTFDLDQSARVTFTFTQSGAGRRTGKRCVTATVKNRRRPRCDLGRGTVTVTGRPGANTLQFSGRIAGRRAPIGAYTVVITAVNAADQRSRSVTLHFTIIKP